MTEMARDFEPRADFTPKGFMLQGHTCVVTMSREEPGIAQFTWVVGEDTRHRRLPREEYLQFIADVRSDRIKLATLLDGTDPCTQTNLDIRQPSADRGASRDVWRERFIDFLKTREASGGAAGMMWGSKELSFRQMLGEVRRGTRTGEDLLDGFINTQIDR